MLIFILAEEMRDHDKVHPYGDDLDCSLCIYAANQWITRNLGDDFYLRLRKETERMKMMNDTEDTAPGQGRQLRQMELAAEAKKGDAQYKWLKERRPTKKTRRGCKYTPSLF